VVAAHPSLDGRLSSGPLEPVVVLAEREALVRALDNLIDNALIHGPAAGQVTITVERRGDRAELTVRDEGPGPDPAHRGRVFERFWRAPEASERPGSGLGLSIVSAVAERHGGRISVEGSAFTLELPALPRGVDPPAA
jgi:signal transduction histidine kinase